MTQADLIREGFSPNELQSLIQLCHGDAEEAMKVIEAIRKEGY